MDNKSSYRQIFKATSLFGGVQIFNIIISIIRSKIIAVLLGPTGMGIAGLLGSTVGLISSLTNSGLGISAVKNIASAHTSGDSTYIAKVVIVSRRLVCITGFIGLFITLVSAPWLSELTFGNRNYTIAFVWLSLTLLFNQLTEGQNVLLQGMRQLRYLAQANILGSIFSLIVSVPMYYFWGVDGIVPALIVTSICSMVIAWYFAKNIKVDRITVNRHETIMEGKDMLRMGFMLSLSGLITTCAAYIVRIYISNVGSTADVGLYTAGFAIIGTYVGLVFTAMGTDYYPRLSGVAQDNKQATDLINHQAEIAILILAPILCGFLIFINWIVILLYSTQFIPINGMIHWAALGMFFKAVSWSIGFIFLAKGHSKTFFYSELGANVYLLIFNIIGYKFWGLNGLGFSFLLGYLSVLFQIYLIAHFKYQFYFKQEFYKIFSLQLLLGVICFCIMKFTPTPYAYIVGTILILISSMYSWVELDKRIGLKQLILSRIKVK